MVKLSIVLLGLLAGCYGTSRCDDYPTVPPANEVPRPISAPVEKMLLSPAEGRIDGVRRLVHVPPETVAPSNPKIAEDVIVVPARTTTTLEGIAGGYSGGCAFESGWELDFGLGPIEDLLMKWASVDKAGAVSITPPAEALGVSMYLAGCEPGTNEWTHKMIVIGDEGLEALHRVMTEYLPVRADDTALPEGAPVDDPVASVETTPLLVFSADADGDGAPEVIVYSFRSWLDEEGVQLAQAGEIGILWNDRSRKPSIGSFGLSQGTAFPAFFVVPPEHDGGALLFYGVHRCCGGTTARYLHLTDGVFSNETFVTKAGDRKVFLEPSKEGRAKLVIE